MIRSLFNSMHRLFRSFMIAFGIDLKQSKGGLLLFILRPHNRESHSYLQHYARLFPHVRFDHLRLGDVIRIPLQLLWLALVRTTPRPVFSWPRWKQHNWQRLAELHLWPVGNVTIKNKRRADQLRMRIGAVAEHFRQFGEDYAKYRCWDYPVIRYLAYGASTLLAFLCMTIPFDPLDQLTFATLLLVIALIAWLASGQAITLLLAGLSIIVSSRYFWWRASSTLNLDENTDFAWGLALLAAEFYTWFTLLMDYFKSCWPVKCSPVELSIQSAKWPSADAIIQTFNEPLNGVARIVFLTAPLAFLLFHAYIIYAPVILLALYVLPHMAHAAIANSRIQGGSRFSFLAAVYKTVLAWCDARHILGIFVNSRKEAFNVAGGSAEKEYFDLTMLTPCILLIGFNLMGVVAGLNRLYLDPHDELYTILLNLVWVFYNLLFLGAAITIIFKFKKTRTTSLPKYGLRGTLVLCLMGYCYLSKLLLLCFLPITSRLSRFGKLMETYLPRSPELLPE